MAVRGFAWISIVVVIGLSVPTIWAQSGPDVTIQGTVVDDSSGAPLPDTHVFISGSMTGTTVGKNGRFRLTEVTMGAKRLYVTRLGYESEQVDLLLRGDTSLTFSFRLEPIVIEAETVTVTAERDEEWYERLARFKRLFIGESPQAQRCYLLNPEVLYFDTAWWGKFEADARAPLRFENRALGYRVTYYLKEFEQNGSVVRWDGEPVFEALVPQDSTQAREWATNRRRAFEGSLRHFLLALTNDRLEEEHFEIHRLPRYQTYRHAGWADRFPATANRLVEAQSDSLYEVRFRGALEVIYEGEPESEAYLEWAQARRRPQSHQVSLIELNERPIHVDKHGKIVEPYGATLFQYFAYSQRMAALLPREYRPKDAALVSATSGQ